MKHSYIYVLLIFFLGGKMATAQNSIMDKGTYDTIPYNAIAADSIFPPSTIHYNWISYQLKVGLTHRNEQLAFQCYFVNRIDSIIYLNLNKSGIELARVVLTPDSVIYVNKLEHKYYQGDYEFIEKLFGLPLHFSHIQSLMNAVDFAGYTQNGTLLEEDGLRQFIYPLRQEIDGDLNLMQTITLGEQGVILENDITELKTLRDIDIAYKDYCLQNDYNFFSKMEIKMESDEIFLEAEMRNLKINREGPTRIKIPDSFEKIKFK